jgi:hypothetical protein
MSLSLETTVYCTYTTRETLKIQNNADYFGSILFYLITYLLTFELTHKLPNSVHILAC